MIRIEFQEPDTPEWRKWKEDAAAATAEAIRAVQNGEKPKINDALYKRMKVVFAEASFGKCAYCETKIWKTDQPGDVEHFRPKGRIIDDDGKPVKLPDGKLHPGYYWLPYDWKNLLLACKGCNSPMKDPETGKMIGKWDRFPVADGFRATQPGEEINEKPLFLHPVFDNPEDHFEFDEKTGILGGKTPRAKACLEILGLNIRDGLIEGRQDAYHSVLARGSQAPNMKEENSVLDEISFLKAYRRGEKPYALAGRKALVIVFARLKRVMDSIG